MSDRLLTKYYHKMGRKVTKHPKKQAQKSHFVQRYEERVGIPCSKSIYKELKSSLYNLEFKLICYQSSRVGIFEYIHNGTKFAILYDRFRDSLVTILFLTDEFLESKGVVVENGKYKIIDNGDYFD